MAARKGLGLVDTEMSINGSEKRRTERRERAMGEGRSLSICGDILVGVKRIGR